jgi:hypothetical protein
VAKAYIAMSPNTFIVTSPMDKPIENVVNQHCLDGPAIQS